MKLVIIRAALYALVLWLCMTLNDRLFQGHSACLLALFTMMQVAMEISVPKPGCPFQRCVTKSASQGFEGLSLAAEHQPGVSVVGAAVLYLMTIVGLVISGVFMLGAATKCCEGALK